MGETEGVEAKRVFKDMDSIQTWDDCLNIVTVTLHKSKDLEDAKNKVGYLQKLIEEKRAALLLDQIKNELGIFKPLF